LGRKEIARRRKRGEPVEPVEIEGRAIARTFWGRAWCEHLESFRDYSSRLPRGRSYVRNGSVVHLEIAEGQVAALVMGSKLYEVRLTVQALPAKRWQAVRRRCEGQIGSLLELLEGRLSESVMAVVTDRQGGLFPLAKEVGFECTCPDWATMCKHVAAACYGVGARLDERPELLFRLRGVDHEGLIAPDASAVAAMTAATAGDARRRIAADELAGVFGIELSEPDVPAERAPRRQARATRRGRAGTTARAGLGRARGVARSPGSGGPASQPKTPPPSSFTGAAVKRLRARLQISCSEFARVLGVSVTAIGNWEGTRGRINLQRRTLAALQGAAELTVKRARGRLRRR